MIVFVATALLGCKKIVEVEMAEVGEPPTEGTTAPVTMVGSGVWTGSGLSLYVPPDWAGREGPEPRVLGLLQAKTGTEFEVFISDPPSDGPRSALSGCDFVNRQYHRAVPLLGLSHTATCEFQGRTRQVWWGSVNGREVHVEVLYAPGEAVRSRQAVGPLLEGLTLSGEDRPSAVGTAP